MALIEIKDVSYSYSRDASLALAGVNLSVDRGKFVGIIGPTGAGKSTLLHLISGAIPHFFQQGQMTGEVRIRGEPVKDLSFADLASHIGTVLQDPEAQIFNLLVEDELTWGVQNLGHSSDEIQRRIQPIVTRFGLAPLMTRTTPTLSGGEKQKLTLAGILAMNPEIMLLDEPTSELDGAGTQMFFQYITELSQEGITILLVEHKIDYLAAHADRIVLLNEGHVVLDGPPAEVFLQAQTLKACGYAPPQVMALFQGLNERKGCNLPLPMTIEEGVRLSCQLSTVENSGISLPTTVDRQASTRRRTMPDSPCPILETRSLWFEYPEPNRVLALKGIDLSIMQGEFVALIGRNGSGKTTLVKHFVGLLQPTRGSVLVNGKDTRESTTAQLARSIGYVFQNPDRQIFHDLVIDEVAYGPSNLGLDKTSARQRSLETLGLLNLESLAYRNAFTLSRGQRQRVAIASILAMDPKVILIDEPTTGQDRREAHSIMKLLQDLNERGYTIVVITHDMTLVAEYAQRVVALLDGDILADGAPGMLFAEPELLELTSIRVPQITEFSLSLRHGIFLTVDEAVDVLGSRLDVTGRELDRP